MSSIPHGCEIFLAVAVLALCFGKPLYDLLRLAANSDLYSYIPLIPVISAYLIWSQRKKLPRISEPAATPAAFFSQAAWRQSRVICWPHTFHHWLMKIAWRC